MRTIAFPSRHVKPGVNFAAQFNGRVVVGVPDGETAKPEGYDFPRWVTHKSLETREVLDALETLGLI